MKSVEISRGRKIFLSRLFAQSDIAILRITLVLKSFWSQFSFKNFRLIFIQIIVSIKNLIIDTKKSLDHKQSHFFTKQNQDADQVKGPVSSFLKKVSDHKKQIHEIGEDNIIK